MNREDNPTASRLPIALVLTLAVSLVAISNESLWIDEGLTAMKAIQPSINAWWQELIEEKNTNLYMPLYMFAVWVWEKILGSSEFSLRALNLPFLLMAGVCVWQASASKRRGWLALMFFLASPFFWLYANEARPYAMQIGWAALLYLQITILANRKGTLRQKPLPASWHWVFALSGFFLLLTHIVGILWEGAAYLTCFSLAGFVWVRQWWRASKSSLLFVVVAHCAFVGYYFWTRHIGVEPNRIGKTTLINLLFWIYEFFGFQGLGPSRISLRVALFDSLRPFLLWLSLLGATWVAASFSAVTSMTRERARSLRWNVGCLIVIPVVLLFALGFLSEARVLPRYGAPAFPIFCVALAIAFEGGWEKGGWRLAAIVLAVIVLLLSSVLLRFSPRHEKDAYRKAAEAALRAKNKGGRVLWAADKATGCYYGLQLLDPKDSVSNKGVFEAGGVMEESEIRSYDWVIVSKPDIYDSEGVIRRVLREEEFELETELPAFQIWKNRDVPSIFLFGYN